MIGGESIGEGRQKYQLVFGVAPQLRIMRDVQQCVSHAAKSEVICTRADLALTPRADHIARTILIRAQKRASAMRFLSLIRFGRVERRIRPLRISRHVTGIRQLAVVVRPIPVARPLPHVPRHVIKTVTVRWESGNCGDPYVAVFPRVLNWKSALKSIRHPPSVWPERIAPNKWFAC